MHKPIQLFLMTLASSLLVVSAAQAKLVCHQRYEVEKIQGPVVMFDVTVFYKTPSMMDFVQGGTTRMSERAVDPFATRGALRLCSLANNLPSFDPCYGVRYTIEGDLYGWGVEDC